MTTRGRFFRFPRDMMWLAALIAPFWRGGSLSIASMKMKHARLLQNLPTGWRERLTSCRTRTHFPLARILSSSGDTGNTLSREDKWFYNDNCIDSPSQLEE